MTPETVLEDCGCEAPSLECVLAGYCDYHTELPSWAWVNDGLVGETGAPSDNGA